MKRVLVWCVQLDLMWGYKCECRCQMCWAGAMFGFQEAAWDSWLKRCSCCHMPTTVTAVVLCIERYIYASYQDTVKLPLPHSLSLLKWDLLFSYPIHQLYFPLLLFFLYLWFPLPFCLPCFALSLLALLLILVSRPPSTSFVEFRQAIYIFLPGCLTSHSLNKVFFIVSVHSDSAQMCVCTCVAAHSCVSLCRGVDGSISLFLFVGLFSAWFLLPVLQEQGECRVLCLQGIFFLCISFP